MEDGIAPSAGWQPIETWTGEDGKEALVYDQRIYLASYDADQDAWWVLLEFTVTPTHYMPLPTPPEGRLTHD